MGARIWRTKPSTRWIWTRARCWRSRCKAPTGATRPRWMRRCAKRDGGGGAGRARGGVAAQRSAEGERGRDRRDGDRQGLSQRRGGEADEGVRRAQLHSGEETKGAAELGGQSGGATSGVREPAAGAGRVRQEFTAAARRVGRAQLRALLRDGRDAALPSARTRQHSETAVGACGRVQPEPDPAPTAGCGHAAGTEKPLCQARGKRSFAVLEQE